MNPSSSKLNYVAPVLRVADLQRAIRYYRDTLGFTLEFEYGGFYASVMRDGCRIHLQCAPAPARDQRAFESAEYLDACFGVENAEALAAACLQFGAIFTVPLRTMPYGKEFYLKDADGYILGFIQPADAT